ncbi:MAG TPA: S4 domain-containing protein [Candidatus Competibacteraceae bacterium]|nr:S4 domain-containing protein [Candidatus Competibacteraceae bacterium]
MKGGDEAPGAARVRLDKWLWAARFFKTRALATAAVDGGKVQVNAQRVKPARAVHVGETLTIRRGTEEFVIVVRALSEQRGPAREAQQLYEETEDSRRKREEAREQRRLLAGSAPSPARRPNKQDRRRIIRFTRQEH